MILSIFFPDNPVHDGAAVIEGDRVSRVGAILPLSRRDDLPSYLGHAPPRGAGPYGGQRCGGGRGFRGARRGQPGQGVAAAGRSAADANWSRSSRSISGSPKAERPAARRRNASRSPPPRWCRCCSSPDSGSASPAGWRPW
ncbi:MAG: DNA integrity scanning protein DisA nucleotide-binding domain protein [Desulfobacterales bacterium]|nr:DNA integrity scanning protein DisA nucleotide-binding domain protein [Desulfobacterales bacterium]